MPTRVNEHLRWFGAIDFLHVVIYAGKGLHEANNLIDLGVGEATALPARLQINLMHHDRPIFTSRCRTDQRCCEHNCYGARHRPNETKISHRWPGRVWLAMEVFS